jgi:predicted acylesterase/phospholipase RssA
MERLRQLFRRRTVLYDPTIPFESLLAGKKLERVLKRYFEDLDIEDLWVPFWCVSADLSRAEACIHERGQLWSAVAASCSIPGIFPPRRDGDRLLVDGGVVDNLPLDLMAARFDGAIVASDVSPYGEGEVHERAERTTAGQLLDFVRWLNPLSPRRVAGPEIFEILLRSSLLGSQRASLTALARGDASLYLPLPVSQFRMLDWNAHEALFHAGYTFARERIAAWQSGRTEPTEAATPH